MNKKILAGLLTGLCFSGQLWAVTAYDINQAYPGGSQVNFNGKIYQAKWYVNPGQSPGLSVTYEWETPWALVGEDDGGGTVTLPSTTGDQTVYFSQTELNAREASLTDFLLMRSVKAAIATRDNLVVDAVQPGRADNPDNVKRLESVLSESQFEFLFPLRAPEYSYRGLLQAAAKFPALCGGYQDGRDAEAICRQSLATMFAHFAQETGAHDRSRSQPEWRQGLYWVREMGWNETMRGGYNAECSPQIWQGQEWPCGKFENGDYKSYFGRGAKQLSYNYNYGPFSDAMFGTVRTLLDSPERVADTWLNLASAVFFFVYPQPPKPSMLHVIDGTWQPNAHDQQNGLRPGFGVTTMIINGGIECGGTTEGAQSQNRISYYLALANYLGVPVPSSELLGCVNMKPFDEAGAGALPIYWENDWSYVAGNPNGGKSYACKLVGYQTRFSAFKPGDYGRCVQHFFPEVVIDGAKALPVNTTETAAHGWSWGDNAYRSVLAATFDNNGIDRLVHVQGFDIDTATEIAVYLNGTRLGYLSKGADSALNVPSLWWLPVGRQSPGTNRIEFRQQSPGYKWGVTGLGIFEPKTAFGNLTTLSGGDRRHGAGFEVHLPKRTDGYLLGVSAYDSGSSPEVLIDLNGKRLLGLPKGPATAWTPKYLTPLPGASLLVGDNRLFIRNRISESENWGVRLDGLKPLNAMLGQLLSLPASERQPNLVTFLLPANATATQLRYRCFDVNSATEVKVWVDGTEAGFCPITGNGLWGTEQALAITSGAQHKVTIDSTTNPPNLYRWGVRLTGWGP
jgi:chitodextrinase